MNKGRLRKSRGKVFQMYPRARRFNESGAELQPVPDIWRCEETSDTRLTLINQRTDHRLCLPFDHVIEFRGDPERDDAGTLVLKTQVFLFGHKTFLEPMHPYRRGDTPLPAEIREARQQVLVDGLGKIASALNVVMEHYRADPRSRVTRRALAARPGRKRI